MATGLKEYNRKRNFRATPEPVGRRSSRRTGASGSLFVVQKHAASRLHYDFRLEMDEVLKSWAVPKGFPFRKGDRRLAVQVEDHPLPYADFEGTIAPGNYGAGTVMLWDRGTYWVHGADPQRALEEGKLHLTLEGEKLKGDWTLVRLRNRDSDNRENWLILKSATDAKPVSASADDRSVASRRTMKQIAVKNEAQWTSDRPASRGGQDSPRKQRTSSKPKSTTDRSAGVGGTDDPDLAQLPSRAAAFIPPMKAVLKEQLPRGKEWLYEIKFDGVRALAVKKARAVSLISRNEKSLTGKYRRIADAVAELGQDHFIIDGEIVALDPEGRPSFQLLQTYLRSGKAKPPIFFYVFDLLCLQGRDLTRLPLEERKRRLEAMVEGAPEAIRFSGHVDAQAESVVHEMKARGLEGIMAKDRRSTYEAGRRSSAWVKVKWAQEQEFVIGGFTPPEGSRSHFGAILVGYYEGSKLMFASKVGTGFDSALLKSLYDEFQKRLTPECPFANLPEKRAGSGGLTASRMKSCTWIRPELVAQVRFTEWTHDGHLRQPVFLGLRTDKAPTEVVREHPSAE